MNKTKLRLYSALTLLFVVSVIGIGLSVRAYQGDSPKVVVEGDYIEAQPTQPENIGSMASPFNMSNPYTCDNEVCKWVVKGSCADKTVDIVSFANPWGVTASTTIVDDVTIRIDGVATSAITAITCGAGTASGATPTYDLMTTGTIATSTKLGCIMSNGLLTADNGASNCPDGGSIQEISLTKLHPYFNCEVTGTMTGGITATNNTFDCEYSVTLKQMR